MFCRLPARHFAQSAAQSDRAEGCKRTGVVVAEQGVDDCVAAELAGVVRLEDRRHVVLRPADAHHAAVDHDQDRLGLRGHHGLEQVFLGAGQAERVPAAAAGASIVALVLGAAFPSAVVSTQANHHHRDIGRFRRRDSGRDHALVRAAHVHAVPSGVREGDTGALGGHQSRVVVHEQALPFVWCSRFFEASAEDGKGAVHDLQLLSISCVKLACGPTNATLAVFLSGSRPPSFFSSVIACSATESDSRRCSVVSTSSGPYPW